MMTLEELTDRIRNKVGEDVGLNATVKFVLKDDAGVIYVDAKNTPNSVSNEDKEADTTIKISAENMENVMNGDMNAMNAFMMGKIKVEGNMGVAMNLNKIL